MKGLPISPASDYNNRTSTAIILQERSISMSTAKRKPPTRKAPASEQPNRKAIIVAASIFAVFAIVMILLLIFS